jgi:hypothetical protein
MSLINYLLFLNKATYYKLSMEVEVNSHMSARGFLQTCLLVLLHVWLALERRRRRERTAGVSWETAAAVLPSPSTVASRHRALALGARLLLLAISNSTLAYLRTVVPNGQNPPKISSLVVIWRVFPSKFQQIHMISVSGHCICFVLNICQTGAGITMTNQFHEFCGSNSWWVFAIWNHSVAQPS